ncbi:MAG: rod shape-determining protein RodA [Bacteroidia bacterium]
MNRQSYTFDLVTFLLYMALVIFGWLTIYAVTDPSGDVGFDKFSSPHVKQLVWIGVSLVLLLVMQAISPRFLEAVSYPAYGLSILLLLAVLLVGKEINGAKSWIVIGGFRMQPSEIAKVATALTLARLMSMPSFSFKNLNHALIAFAIIAVPAVIIVLQRDAGSALVFGSFLIVFFREGLNPLIPAALLIFAAVLALTLGLGVVWAIVLVCVGGVLFFVLTFNARRWVSSAIVTVSTIVFLSLLSFSAKYAVDKLPKHQQNRLMVLFHPDEVDPKGRNEAYNFNQSVTAIGSGGFWGKGYREGTYTKYEFVPEQETDFIFCTIGEERGWFGSLITIGLLFGFLMRIRFVAENGKTRFLRVFGYGALGIYFFHIMVNIGMTIGLMPVIGIPLPFFSYGGSGLLGFSMLIAILLSLYGHRSGILGK